MDVALASEAEGCGFDPQLDARFLPQHVDPPINCVVTWLRSFVTRLELSEIGRDISLQIIIIIISTFISSICSVVTILHIVQITILKLPFFKLSMTFHLHWMRVSFQS